MNNLSDTPNNVPKAFNEAALVAAKAVDPRIPDGALPIVFMRCVDIWPEPEEVNLELGGDPDDLNDWGGIPPRDVLKEIKKRRGVMWMPEDYVCYGFAVYDGEKFGPAKWFIPLRAGDLPKPYDENKVPANA